MRSLLATLALVIALLPISGVAQGDFDQRRLTFQEAVSQALFYGGIVDSLPEEVFAVIDDQQDLNDWAAEIVPFFGYEGITGEDSAEFSSDPLGRGYVYPERMSFEFFDEQGSLGHHHILGMANCMSGEMWMNERFSNPVSSAYQSKAVLEVLVHELAHIQGICLSGEEAEISAQLVTLEVLSSMAVKGNEAAFASLMLALEGMYTDAALAMALDDNRLEEFEYIFGLDGLTGGSALAQAAWDKTMRYWADDPEYLMDILMKYNFMPMALIQREIGAANPQCVYASMQWNTEKQEIEYDIVQVMGMYCINGVELPINLGTFSFPLVIDDLAYVMEHAESLALEIGA